MPHVATSPSALLSPIAGAAHVADGRLVIDDEAGFRDVGDPRPCLDRRLQHGRGDDRCGPVARLGGQPGARRPLGQHPGPVRRTGPRRGRGLHRTRHQYPRPDLRHGPDDLRDRRRRRCRGGHPRARPQRTDLHVPATDRLRHLGPGGGDRGGLARAGLHPGRSLPVQREEVRRRSRGDDRGDPAGLPARDRRRLSQHRHRLVHPGGPLQAERRRGTARELHARRRADGAHPVARGRWGHGQCRRRDRRGRDAEFDGRGAARLPRWLPARPR